jgi:hypothetical protein
MIYKEEVVTSFEKLVLRFLGRIKENTETSWYTVSRPRFDTGTTEYEAGLLKLCHCLSFHDVK